MNPFTMSGLELLQAAVDGKIPPASIAETIPMTVVHVESGVVRFSARADARHLNPLGGVHGGFAATVLDSVTGCAVHTMLEAGVGYGTVDLHVTMVRPVPRDTDLVATGRVINLSRNLAVSEGRIETAEGKLLAHATATCMIQRS